MSKFKLKDRVTHFGSIGTIEGINSLSSYNVVFDDGHVLPVVYESELTLVEETNGDIARWEDEGGRVS